MNFKSNILLVLVLIFSQSIQAKTRHALLVGVSNYYHLPAQYQLDGPVNDAVIVNKMLRSRGFAPENITQLASGKDKNKNKETEPTRKNIIAALENLAKSSKEGDFVYLHFAGHGSRQPAKAKNNDEADGLDEIFLPADAKEWNSYIGSVTNAITDNDIAGHIDRIRNNGSNVWVVFDSCHSGSMTRGIGQDEVRYRKILGSDLGIPDSLVRQANSSLSTVNTKAHSRGFSVESKPKFDIASTSSSKNIINDKSIKKGALIAFSAAQSEQTTPEMKLPRGNSDRKYHGLFTYSLVEVLSKNRGISYQQLAQQIMSRYQSVPWHTTTPLLSATNMGASVFNESGDSVNQWQAIREQDQLKIPAGQLNQFSKGAVIGVYENPTSKTVIAQAVITKSHAMQSKALIEDKLTGKKVDISTIPTKSYVRLLSPKIDFQLGVSIMKTRHLAYKEFEMLNNKLDKVAKNNALLIRKEKSPAKTDIFVALFNNKLWFITPEQNMPCEVQAGLNKQEIKQCETTRKPERMSFLPVPHGANFQNLLRQGLLRIAKARNLLAIQSVLGKQSKSLKMEFLVEKGNSKKPVYKVSPKLKTGDWVNLKIENTSNKGQDVSVLFVDSQYGIQLAHPRSGEPNVLKPKESLKLRFQVNVDTTGYEHFVVLHAQSTGIVQSFSFMEQPPLSITTRGLNSGVGNSPLQQMMNAARTGAPMSRGLALGGNSTPPPQSGLNIFSWQTLP